MNWIFIKNPPSRLLRSFVATPPRGEIMIILLSRQNKLRVSVPLAQRVVNYLRAFCASLWPFSLNFFSRPLRSLVANPSGESV